MAKITRKANETIIDVREMLRAGQEPFPDIMRALASLPADHSLVLLATFKPEPLIELLGSQGFESEAVPLDDGEGWQVTFRRTEAAVEPAEH